MISLEPIDLVHDLVHTSCMTVNIHQAKTHFSQLVEKALAGEEVLIARNGQVLLSLVPVPGASLGRRPGLFNGKGSVAASFTDPLAPAVLAEFEK